MRQIADALMSLMFFMTALYVSYRIFPETTQSKIGEANQWWMEQKQHLEQHQGPQQLEEPSRVANSKPN